MNTNRLTELIREKGVVEYPIGAEPSLLVRRIIESELVLYMVHELDKVFPIGGDTLFQSVDEFAARGIDGAYQQQKFAAREPSTKATMRISAFFTENTLVIVGGER